MFSSYYEEIEKKYEKLTTEQELDLAKKIKKGDKEAENRLICCNLKFVVNICHRYQGQGVILEDLIGAGNIGLVEASKRYDPYLHNGEKFITFAVWYIKHYIFKAIKMYKFLYRIPNTYHNDILKYYRVKDNLEKKYNRPPTKEELVKAMGIKLNHLDTIIDLLDQNKFVNLSDFINKAKNITYEDVVCSDRTNVDSIYSLRERREKIFKALESLTDREKRIIISYYGLSDVKFNLKELSKDLGITKEAVRVIKNKALKKLEANDKHLKELL